MNKILVTGGSGFIGSHTCFYLLSEGYDIYVLDSLVNSSLEVLDKINKINNLVKIETKGNFFFREGDLRDTKWLDGLFNEFEEKGIPIDSVIHFAGLKSVSESAVNPIEYWDVNVGSSISLFSVMEKHSCFKIVFSSSATIYKPNQFKKLMKNLY